MPFPLIRLTPADASRYARLRLRMLNDAPWAYSASPEDDRALNLDLLAASLEEDDSIILAVEEPSPAAAGMERGQQQPEIIAAVSIVREKARKFAHRATIWGVFVEPAHRGKGLGRELMSAAIELARKWPGVSYVDLGVSEKANEARRLYESLGFEQWGREPEATEHNGQRYDEIHMTLRL